GDLFGRESGGRGAGRRRPGGGTYIGPPMASPPSPSPSPPPPSAPRRVLFVEDESALRRTYQRFFSTRYDVAFAASGSEARRQLEDFRPEVLVLDLRLPDTDGVTLLQEIRQSRPSLPVLVTTSYVSMEPLI